MRHLVDRIRNTVHPSPLVASSAEILAVPARHVGADEDYAAELVDMAAMPDAEELAGPRVPTDPVELEIDIAFQRLIASWHETPDWLAAFVADSMTHPHYRALRLESTGEHQVVTG